MRIRPAQDSDVNTLTEIAHAAKRSWQYPDDWIEAWRADLTITARDVRRWTILVAEIDTGIAGFAAVARQEDHHSLEHLWVRPGAMRRGLGSRLLRAAADAAAAEGANRLRVVADPNAVPFYEKYGGHRVGTLRADILGHRRQLPVLDLVLPMSDGNT